MSNLDTRNRGKSRSNRSLDTYEKFGSLKGIEERKDAISELPSKGPPMLGQKNRTLSRSVSFKRDATMKSFKIQDAEVSSLLDPMDYGLDPANNKCITPFYGQDTDMELLFARGDTLQLAHRSHNTNSGDSVLP